MGLRQSRTRFMEWRSKCAKAGGDNGWRLERASEILMRRLKLLRATLTVVMALRLTNHSEKGHDAGTAGAPFEFLRLRSPGGTRERLLSKCEMIAPRYLYGWWGLGSSVLSLFFRSSVEQVAAYCANFFCRTRPTMVAEWVKIAGAIFLPNFGAVAGQRLTRKTYRRDMWYKVSSFKIQGWLDLKNLF